MNNKSDDTRLLSDLHQAEMRTALNSTIRALSTMLELRDAYTSGHQKRVSHIAVTIAKECGLASDRIHSLEIAASIHDIGKISIPYEILNKPSKLSTTEFALIKTHPEVGYQILKNIDFSGPVAEIIRQHHEYLDGSGYPFGLKDQAILTEAKILTVSDIIESMISHRPYRAALPVDFALSEFKKMRGIKLDPQVVDICIKLYETNRITFLPTERFNTNPLSQDISRT